MIFTRKDGIFMGYVSFREGISWHSKFIFQTFPRKKLWLQIPSPNGLLIRQVVSPQSNQPLATLADLGHVPSNGPHNRWRATRVFAVFLGIGFNISIGCGPLTVTVTIRIITFSVGNPYKPSFPTVTVRGPHPKYHPSSFRKLSKCKNFRLGVPGNEGMHTESTYQW